MSNVYPTGEYLVVLKKGVVLRSIGSGCSTDSEAAFDVDFYKNEADYLERGCDNVIREADGSIWVFAPNGPSCVPAEWGPWAGVWCRVPSLEVLGEFSNGGTELYPVVKT